MHKYSVKVFSAENTKDSRKFVSCVLTFKSLFISCYLFIPEAFDIVLSHIPQEHPVHINTAFSEIQFHVLLTVLPDCQRDGLFHHFALRAVNRHGLLQGIIHEHGNRQLRQRTQRGTHPEYQFIPPDPGESQLIYRTGAFFRGQFL